MDYSRIYHKFIADRRSKPKPEGYTERHHILPVSLGGGDEPANLISLTARDHYFAHCCLAKVHGGKMWSALFAVANMAKTDEAWRYFCRRRMVESARHMAARQRSEHMRELWASGRFRRNRKYVVSVEQKAKTRAALVGRPKDPDAIRRMVETKNRKAARFVFAHVSGTRFTGTAYDLRRRYDLYQSSMSRLVAGKLNTVNGWRIVRQIAPSASSNLSNSTA